MPSDQLGNYYYGGQRRQLTQAQIRAIANLATNYGRPAVRWAYDAFKARVGTMSGGDTPAARAARNRRPGRKTPAKRLRKGKRPSRQSDADMMPRAGYTAYGMNYSKNIKTKGKRGWKGKLTIPHSRKKMKRYRRTMPYNIMQRYFLTNYENLDLNNQILSYPQDMLKVNPSVDAKHMSCLVLNIGATENHLDPNHYIIGKQLAPFSGATGTQNDKNAVIWENNSDNTALIPFTIPYQVNKFPSSALGARGLAPIPPEGSQWPYKLPSTVLTGLNLNLVFKGSRPFDQILSVKVVRCTLPEPINPGEWNTVNSTAPGEVIQRELCNRANFTSRLAFETIWTKSIKLRGIKGGNQKIPTVRCKKFIKMQYLRSYMRRISTAGDQATLGSQSLPNTYQVEDGLFNNLYVVCTAKTVDDEYVATLTDKAGPAGTGGDGTETRGALRTIPPPDIAENGYESEKQTSSFRFGGTFSVYRRAKEVDTGIASSLESLQNQQQQSTQGLQDQLTQLQDQVSDLTALAAEHETDCDSDTDCEETDSDSDDEESDSDCGTGHQAGASAPGDGHTHPNSLTAEEHAANCQHSH